MPLGSQLNSVFGTQGALAVLGELASIAATGTTQGSATAITTPTSIVTTVAAGAGVRLPVTPTVSAGDRLHVANHGANALAVYPPTSGKLSNNGANVPAMIAPNKCGDFLCIDGTNYSALLSA